MIVFYSTAKIIYFYETCKFFIENVLGVSHEFYRPQNILCKNGLNILYSHLFFVFLQRF